jgi:hypothetical protein
MVSFKCNGTISFSCLDGTKIYNGMVPFCVRLENVIVECNVIYC